MTVEVGNLAPLPVCKGCREVKDFLRSQVVRFSFESSAILRFHAPRKSLGIMFARIRRDSFLLAFPKLERVWVAAAVAIAA